MASSVTFDGPAVESYLVYSGILAIKVLALAYLTAKVKYSKRSKTAKEDKLKGRVKSNDPDPDVERVRRAHLNDLENIPVFWVLGALYLTTGPSVWLATMLFRVFTVARVLHTIVYAVTPLPQPSRALAFFVGYLVTGYMGVKVIGYYLHAL